jgi:predicted transcriptional regulator of viral defense system
MFKNTKNAGKGEFLDILLRSPQTIFSTKDMALLWHESDGAKITNRLKKYVTAGKLVRIRRGLYAKDTKYNHFELATRIITPAYVSFETVLARAGIIFQHYEAIFVASYVKRDMVVKGKKLRFFRLKETTLHSTAGIVHGDGYAVATKERAFLDRLYVSKRYHFDTLAPLDWKKVHELLPLYESKRLETKVRQLEASQK